MPSEETVTRRPRREAKSTPVPRAMAVMSPEPEQTARGGSGGKDPVDAQRQQRAGGNVRQGDHVSTGHPHHDIAPTPTNSARVTTASASSSLGRIAAACSGGDVRLRLWFLKVSIIGLPRLLVQTPRRPRIRISARGSTRPKPASRYAVHAAIRSIRPRVLRSGARPWLVLGQELYQNPDPPRVPPAGRATRGFPALHRT